MELIYRPKRLRRSPAMRKLVRETRISTSSLIYPLFITEQPGVKQEISAMPGQYHWSADRVCEAVDAAMEAGIGSFLLFGLPLPEKKDADGSQGWAEDGVVQQGIAAIKRRFPEALVIADTCLCEYTDHGHCGRLDGEHIDNDATLLLLGKTAVSQAQAGADMVAPSAMTDGQVLAIRKALDEAKLQHIPIMSYSAKYASAFYGPFREAVASAPSFGDRQTYQMDYHNAREGMRENALDEAEGADCLIVKPAMSYLDIVCRLRTKTGLPIAAYSVSGEYSMIKAAAAAGYADERRIMMETATSIYRAGADILISYYAPELAEAISKGDMG